MDQVKKAWNAFKSSDDVRTIVHQAGPGSSRSPQRTHVGYVNERSTIASIYTRVGIDVAGVPMRHIKVDDNDLYADDISSSLNMCFQLEPNIDQGPRAFRQDIVSTLFDDGVAAIVPVDTAVNPANGQFDVYSMRVGKVVQWYPKHVMVRLYNEATGRREDILLEKRFVAIVQNPLYDVVNEYNSTLQRLLRKLHLLDVLDERVGSGKLDLIIQLPYVIKTEAKKLQAEKRRDEIEYQLSGSQYGIAYADGTEKITQLNRPVENNLLKQVEYLTNLLYTQLGLTEDVMNGTADEKTMLNYFNRTVEPILDAVIEAFQRAFLGVLGTQRHERVRYFRDPFKLVPISEIAVIADKFSRNEILSANEIRAFIGVKPSKDPKADELRNSNMPEPEQPEEDVDPESSS